MKKVLIFIIMFSLFLTGCEKKEEDAPTRKTTKAEDVLVITADSDRPVSEHTSKSKPVKTYTTPLSSEEIVTTLTTTSATTTDEFAPINNTSKATTKVVTNTTIKSTTKGTTKKTTTTTKKSTTKTTKKTTTKTSTGTLTEKQVYNKIIALKKTYPTGTSWTADREYRWKASNRTNYYGYGCVAFAYMLSDAAFGTAPARQITGSAIKSYKVKIGDLIRVNNGNHTVVVIGVTDKTITTAEGTVILNGKEIVYWDRTISNKDRSGWTYIWTRY